MKKRSARKPRRRKSTSTSLEFETLEDRKLMATLTSVMGPVVPSDFYHSQMVQTQESASTQEQSGNANSSIQRIVNGEQTDGYEAVGYLDSGCTGTLISPTHVLTAAHCVEGLGNGGISFEAEGQKVQSVKITSHPDYNPDQFDRGDDLAIIELARPITGVTPMEINRAVPQVGTMLTLVGFGEGGTSTGGFDSNDNGKQVGQTELEVVTQEHISWNFDSHNEANTAPGDSGGPAFINQGGQLVIAGVTSGGEGDAHSLGDFSFDTRIDVHAQWIDDIVGDTGGGDGGGDGGGSATDDHANNPDNTATQINLNKNGAGGATGKLEVAGDRDAFKFTITESGQTKINLTGTSGDLDTYLRVYNQQGQIIAQNDDSGNSTNSQLNRNLAKGTYYVVAGAYNDEGTGDFRVNIKHTADNNGGGGSGNGNSTTFTNNQDKVISEDGRSRAVSWVRVTGMTGEISDINVTVDIDHTYTEDLRIVLVSPDNQRVILVNRQGEDGNNFRLTEFDQQATRHINHGDAPFRGTFRPVRSLEAFNGSNANGVWRIAVLDFADGDGGMLKSFSLEVTTTESSRQKIADTDRSTVQSEWQGPVRPSMLAGQATANRMAQSTMAQSSTTDGDAMDLVGSDVDLTDAPTVEMACIDLELEDSVETVSESGSGALGALDAAFASFNI